MQPSIKKLIHLLHKIADDENPSPHFPELAEANSCIPSPWAAWLLVCLIQQHFRHVDLNQRICKLLLEPNEPFSELGRLDGLEGVIPASPNLSYEVHDLGIVIRDRVTGQSNFLPLEQPFCLNCSFHESFSSGTGVREYPGRRLRVWHKSEETLPIAAFELASSEWASLLSFSSDYAEVEFATEAKPLLEAWLALEPRLCDENVRQSLAALLGDWRYFIENQLWAEYEDAYQGFVKGQFARRRALILKLSEDEKWLSCAVNALAECAAPELGDCVARCLKAAPEESYGASSPRSEAIRLVGELKLEAFYPQVLRAMKQSRPQTHVFPSDDWFTSAEVLLSGDYRTEEVIEELLQAPQGLLTVALLCLKYAPDRCRDQFRRAITDEIPGLRERVAGMMAILDEPWTREVLSDLLEHSRDRQIQFLCLATLAESSDRDTRTSALELAERWLQEAGLRSAACLVDVDLLRQTTADFCDEVFPLRGRVR